MTPRELVALVVATFRAAPVRASGTEAVYRVHLLRASLEELMEACAAALVGQSSQFTARAVLEAIAVRWLELRAIVAELPTPAPLGTIEGVVERGRSLHRRILELLTCDHQLMDDGRGVAVVETMGLCICARCGAHRIRRDPWDRPELLEQLGRFLGVLS
jgi:hypothetical protein